MTEELKCADCNEPAAFFHSRCCGAHFEGVITNDKELTIACEKCGKFSGYVVNKIKSKEDKNE